LERVDLGEAAVAMGAEGVAGGDAVITKVCTDTREGAEGALFFALRGENADGHRYVADAFMKGAVAAVVENEVPGVTGRQLVVPDTLVALGNLAAHYRDRFDIPVVAVTGSVGKTSTKEMLSAALRGRFNVLASVKNFNNEIGVPLTLFRLEPGHEVALIEMGMRAEGEIARLAEIARPTLGIITNIGLSHIERLGSRDGIARAKAELLEALDGGTAVLPADDDYAAFLLDTCRSRCRAVTFGRSATADFAVSDVSYSEEGRPRFRINGQTFELQAPGTHLPLNAAAVCAAADSLGVALEEVSAALAEYRAPAMRMETVRTKHGQTILNDAYNAAPDSMRAALETLVLLAGGRRAVAVLGEMRELGEFGPEAHRYVGRLAGEQPLAMLATVGEAAEEIARVAAEALGAEHVRTFASTEEAAEKLPVLLGPDDVVLVKGSRAMEMERIVRALEALP
jgi:UDP-N-acetylmuramoyl-tripeptide--D-alanyl-D-alanine ligase